MEIIDNSDTPIVEKETKINESEDRTSGCIITTPKDEKNEIKMMMFEERTGCLNIGDRAPSFIAETTLGKCKLEDFRGKWLCLFSHPADFTPVCTTEFISFAKMEPEFKKRNCCLLGLSIDSLPSHLAWIHNINKMTGIAVPFPVIADSNMEIAKKYGMIPNSYSSTSTARSVYIICPEGKIRAILTYPATTGRNISEILRLIDALQFSDAENLVTPANWVPGMPAIVKPPMCYQEVMERINNPGDLACYDFYLCFKQPQGIPTMQMPTQMPNPITTQMPCQIPSQACPNSQIKDYNNCSYNSFSC